MNKTFFAFLLLCFVPLLGCKKETEHTLSTDASKIDIPSEGGTAGFTIKTDAGSWSISNPASNWLTLSKTSSSQPLFNVTLTVNSKTIQPRTATLTITAGNASPVELIVTQPSSEYLYTLTADSSSLNFKKTGNSTSFSVTTDAPQCAITSNASWLTLSQSTGTNGKNNVIATSSDNSSAATRTAIITITAAYAPSISISVAQKGNSLYPGYNTSPIAADAGGMNSTATELAANIKLGINIGNTLEAIGGETAWGNPKTTKALIDKVKQSGFNAVRLPCSWNQYMENSSSAKLKTEWLSRVKEVVQYCTDNNMYVILNIHWDGGWLENNCTVAKQLENNAKQKAFWEQIATKLRDFDEHLLFAGANEPNVTDATQMAVLKSYHQTFIDAVRSTGGKNSYRVLVIQGPSTDIEKTRQLMTSLPVDNIANRLMAEIHYYTPWNFCGMAQDESWGKMFYYWGSGFHSTSDPDHNANWGEESDVNNYFNMMKTQFVDKGIPVVLGEYGPMRRSTLTGDALTLHLASRAYYLKYVTKQAKASGILPFVWDTGGLFDRKNNTVLDQQALDALIQGAAK